MRRSKFILILAACLIGLSLLALLRYRMAQKPRSHEEETYHRGPDGAQERSLTVAFIPVTCHLTCPVTDYASKTSTTGTRFDAMRFSEFPSIVEALRSKKLLAGFLTVPIAMKMREQGSPIKIACLGHRDGSQLVVRKENPAKDLRDLRGKTVAIPSPFSNENFFINKMMRDQGVEAKEINFVVLPPPDMTAALQSKSIDGFIVAEPFCAKAELEGYGRVLYYAKDIWPRFVSCVLVVRDELIKEHPEMVRDLVRGIAESGEWAEQHRLDAARVAAPYFRQDQKLLEFVLTQPPDRVSYRQLTPTDDDMEQIMKYAVKAGILRKPLDVSDIIDRRFIPAEIHPAKIPFTSSRSAEMSPH